MSNRPSTTTARENNGLAPLSEQVEAVRPNPRETGLQTIEARAETELSHEALGDTPAEQEEARQENMGLALREACEAFDEKELGDLLRGIDFADEASVDYTIGGNYHSPARVVLVCPDATQKRFGEMGWRRGRCYSGKESDDASWGDPWREALDAGAATEQVRVHVRAYKTVETRRVPRRGILGRLGLTREEKVLVAEPPMYVFSYEFNAPAHPQRARSPAEIRAGNNSGQSIRLDLKLDEEQARKLSKILEKNPKAARSVLDAFVRETGDYGKWNAELYDGEGDFHDPGERYNDDSFRAWMVRPQFDVVPDLEPRVVGLLDERGDDVSSSPR